MKAADTEKGKNIHLDQSRREPGNAPKLMIHYLHVKVGQETKSIEDFKPGILK